MGALMTWLVRGVVYGVPVIMSYFFTDTVNAVVAKLPAGAQKTVADSKGNVAWWFIVVIGLVLGGITFLVIKLLSGKRGKKVFSLVLGSLCLLQLGLDFRLVSFGLMCGTALVTLTTGAAVVTSVNLTYLPKRLFYAAATQLTGIKITVQGDGVLFDSDANGLTHVGLNRIIGQVTNNYIINLANGLIKNKNVLYEFTNSGAQTPVVYIDSDNTPDNSGETPLFLQMMKVPVFVGGTDYSDFATMSLPSLAAGDSVSILYADGTVQSNMNRLDLQTLLGYTQNVVNTPLYTIDNFDQKIRRVTVTALAAQTGYIQRWVPSLSGGMVRGEANA